MKLLFLTILLVFSLSLQAQLKNEKAVVVENGVKSVIVNTCAGSCSGKYSKFDHRGNVIEWDFYRAATWYRFIYDKSNRKIMSLWVDKTDTTKIDTVYPKVEPILEDYVETYDADCKQLTKTYDYGKEIITYDECKNPIEEVRLKNGEVVFTKTTTYDKLDRVLESKVKKSKKLKYLNQNREHMNKAPIPALIESFKYNEKGQVEELYTYLSDPCMGLANHFRYVYIYHKNGLIKTAEAFEEGAALAFTLEYSYEFYDR